MKILFLDVDGVLNSAQWFASQDKTKDTWTVDPKAVKRITRLCAETDTKIVLSSTWRKYDTCLQVLANAGLFIYEHTPLLPHDAHRGGEIEQWLYQHMEEVRKFAIVDDDTDAGEGEYMGVSLKNFYVRTHWKFGLYGKHERLLKELLQD